MKMEREMFESENYVFLLHYTPYSETSTVHDN